jgi:undecaprenyl-phosphate galactose phosphotransferase
LGNLQIFDTEVQNETEENEQLAEAIYTPIYTPKPIFDFFKRVFDVFASLICIVVGLPVYLIIAAVIIIDDPGNPFFAQERVGLNGKHYMCLKWRSMYMDAEARKAELAQQNEYDSVHFKMANDPRITRVGHFLRKTSLDETAQFLNILFNDMSFIGPRPFVVKEQDQLPSERLAVKPGLSCYWQITDTTKMSTEEQLELDYKYIRERSVSTDLSLIFKTIMVVFKGKNC